MNAVRTFIDTNILVYAFTSDEPIKQETALRYLDGCRPVMSLQVIKEFSNVLLKKTNTDLQVIRDTIVEIAGIADITGEDFDLITASFDVYKRYKYSFYDSLIIAAALNSRCRVLLSEDMQNGQIINGKLKIINPFMSGE